ncbi:hypothetical protein [Escherichia coli]|uniref:hypothetical protein n=1 Tax=Escherichia coli TaxID=562 RepID=UPI001FCD45B8|nr:hypothetical protein [Escherichia coli]
MPGSAFAVTHHAFSSGAGRTSDGNGSHASTLKSPSYTKSVSWQHYPVFTLNMDIVGVALLPLLVFIVLKTIKNRSLVNGLYSAMNMTIRAAGLLKGLMQPMRDPIVPPGNKIIHR